MRKLLAAAFGDDRAVSAVVGIVLMVGITVVLVTVVAVPPLGFGGELEEPEPQASFEYQYDEAKEVTHRGGETLDADEVYIKWGGKTVVWGEATSVSVVSSGLSITLGAIDADDDGNDPPPTGSDTDDLVGPEEKVFMVHQPRPERATILGSWHADDS